MQVRQVSHWITATSPTFYEPLRTAAAFKMLPDPAFVVCPLRAAVVQLCDLVLMKVMPGQAGIILGCSLH